MLRPRPGPGWKLLGGAVYGHVSGIRIHIYGMMVMPSGEWINGRRYPEVKALDYCIRVCGGSRKRGTMAWALRRKKFSTKADAEAAKDK